MAPGITFDRLSFLFKIEPVEPNFQAQSRRTSAQNFWEPPNIRQAYRRFSRPLYRWKGGYVSSIPASEQAQLQTAKIFRAATVFTQSPGTDHLLAVNIDAQRRSVGSDRSWRTLSFDYRRIGSSNQYRFYVCPEAPRARLSTPGPANWMPQLLPTCYNPPVQPNPQGQVVAATHVNAGLIGKLPILIALAAFSAPCNQQQQVLMSSIRPNAWHPHSYAPGRGELPKRKWLDASTHF